MVIGPQWPGWICSGDEMNFLWGTNWIPIYDIVERSHYSPCGGGLECLQRNSAIRKRQQKGNPVPGGITGPPYSWGYKYGNLALRVEEVSDETVIYGCEFYGTSNQEWLLWQGPEAIVQVNYRPILSSKRALQNNKPTTVWGKFQGERKIDRWSQMGVWYQDRLADWLSVAN
jgi:hypothetical protein